MSVAIGPQDLIAKSSGDAPVFRHLMALWVASYPEAKRRRCWFGGQQADFTLPRPLWFERLLNNRAYGERERVNPDGDIFVHGLISVSPAEHSRGILTRWTSTAMLLLALFRNPLDAYTCSITGLKLLQTPAALHEHWVFEQPGNYNRTPTWHYAYKRHTYKT